MDKSAQASPTIPHPSMTKPMSSPEHVPPELYHSLHQKRSSVLSLAADDKHLFSGSQGDDISVWDKETFRLKTTLRGHTGSVLVLEYAADERWILSASGDSTVRIWSAETLTPLYVLNPHLDTDSGDIFCLAWDPRTKTVFFGCQNTSIQWFCFKDILAERARDQPVPEKGPLVPFPMSASGLVHTPGTSTPRKVHKFFDSYPQYERRTPDLNARNPTCSNCSTPSTPPNGAIPPPHRTIDPCISSSQPPLLGLSQSPAQPSAIGLPNVESAACACTPTVLQVPSESMIWSAHYGYVYCMAIMPSVREGSDDGFWEAPPQLVTGSGDGTVKVWALSPTPVQAHTFDCGIGAVLSVVVRGDTVFAGCQDGYVKVWDLDTRTLVRSLIVAENVDILALSMLHSDLYTCSANGEVQRWSASFVQTASWPAHEGIVLSSIVTRLSVSNTDTDNPKKSSATRDGQGFVLVTGGNDDQIRIWDIKPPKPPPHAVTTPASVPTTLPISDTIEQVDESQEKKEDLGGDTLVHALSQFVAIPSVSGSSAHHEDRRQAAIWLRKWLGLLGARAQLVTTGAETSPIVLATFQGKETTHRRPRILFYGHYDVISARPQSWTSDPFTLSARNGYLYGRGVTDNKGPIIAVACAAAELLGQRKLDADVVLLVEGEEESGSVGFGEAVRKAKECIGPIDAILVSNSTWIAEDTPCITYGLRGVVHCKVQISNQGPDLHSGVDGGPVSEPMMDMVKLLGTLTDSNKRVALPEFYDAVRPLTEEERQLYKVLSGVIQTPASVLSAKWREPSLTIHDVRASSATNSTIIPSSVTARVSIRIVPDQDLDTIAKTLQDHLRTTFESMGSPNSIEVSIPHRADWWLGNLDDLWFTALEDAVRDEWGVEPLRIREGGSIPSVPFLEKEFGCHALHLPMGQSTDQAHLPNERMSLLNLRRGKNVVERFLGNVVTKVSSAEKPNGAGQALQNGHSEA